MVRALEETSPVNLKKYSLNIFYEIFLSFAKQTPDIPLPPLLPPDMSGIFTNSEALLFSPLSYFKHCELYQALQSLLRTSIQSSHLLVTSSSVCPSKLEVNIKP